MVGYLFAFFEFLQDFLLDGEFSHTFLVGFGSVFFTFELEGDFFALNVFTVDFSKGDFDNQFFSRPFNFNLLEFNDVFNF